MLPRYHQPIQMDFSSQLYSPMERLLLMDQVRYRKPIKIVKQFFDFCMQLRIQGAIRITPNYPDGWFAEALSEDKIWTIECYRGEIKLIRVGDLIGYTHNGGYITANEEDLSDNIVCYEQCHQWCGYRGKENEPIYCRDFCDDGDYNEIQCLNCPWT